MLAERLIIAALAASQAGAQVRGPAQQHAIQQHPVDNYFAVFLQIGRFFSVHHDAIEAFAAFGGLIAALLLALVTAGLWVSTRSLATSTADLAIGAREQSETSRAQLRAYVVPVPRGMSIKQDCRTIRIYLEVENVGVTPSFRTRVIWGAIVRPHPLTGPLQFDEDEVFKGAAPVVYPGRGHTPSREFKLTDEEFKALKDPSSKYALYVGGRLRYIDAFKRDQEAEFCAFLIPEEFNKWYNVANTRFDEIIEARFRFAEFHNTASI